MSHDHLQQINWPIRIHIRCHMVGTCTVDNKIWPHHQAWGYGSFCNPGQPTNDTTCTWTMQHLLIASVWLICGTIVCSQSLSIIASSPDPFPAVLAIRQKWAWGWGSINTSLFCAGQGRLMLIASTWIKFNETYLKYYHFLWKVCELAGSWNRSWDWNQLEGVPHTPHTQSSTADDATQELFLYDCMMICQLPVT